MKIEAILFDLDNTLVFFDEKKFFEAYTYKLSKVFSDLFTLEEFGKRLMHSSVVMTNNDGKINNADYFINDFAAGLDINHADLWQRFEDFYASEFEKFESLMTPLAGLKEIFIKIKEMGIKIVIASNPMFPLNVQLFRLKWAGLEDVEFDLITHAQNSTYCKPNPAYYAEICEKINVTPENCLMVGNDAFNDMIASKIGMKTYLTTEGENNKVEVSRELTKNNKFELPDPDFKGKVLDLLNILN